jgi:hypothetical protein
MEEEAGDRMSRGVREREGSEDGVKKWKGKL